MDFTLWIQDSRYSRLSIIRTFKENKKSSSYQEQNYIEKDLEGSSYQFCQWNVVSRFQLLADCGFLELNSGLQSHISLHEAKRKS